MAVPIRILFLTQYFPPETGAPQARLSELALRLTMLGHEVQVLTGMPNYPTGSIFAGYRRRLWVREQWQGIPVVRTAILPSRSARMVARLGNYFSFVATAILLGPFLVRRPHIVLVESPPLFLGIAALFFRFLFRARLIANISDLWPESAVFMGLVRNQAVIRATRALERWLYRLSDACTGQSVGIVRGIRRAWPQAHAFLVPNGSDCRRFSPDAASADFRAELAANNKVLIGYAGLLGLAQGVDIVLRVAKRCASDSRLHFVIVGDGPEREEIVAQMRREGLSNVSLYGHVGRERMPGIVAAFDIALIPLRHSIPGALPSKVYEAMASAVSVVLAAGGDAAELVARANCGIVFPYEDVAAVSEALERLARDPDERRRLGACGRSYVERHHDFPVIAGRMDRIVRAVADRRVGELEPELV